MSPGQAVPITTRPRGKRGQTLAEFALTLPILLMLMFGVIEFARIFQAWITLQNAAREAARYAVTGQWNPTIVAQAIGYPTETALSPEAYRAAVLDALVPCTTGYDQAFARHWGRDCEPGSDEDQGLRADMARIPAIIERARHGAAGLSLADGENIVGLTKADGQAINTETVGEDERGWFHVWMCSTRPGVINLGNEQRYRPSEDRSDRICEVRGEGAQDGTNQYDAGGPGNRVEIVVFFNHPLITPLGLVDHIQIQARRVMINESFRASRVVNLPERFFDSPTPSNTPLPTSTFTLTPLPTKTFTPTFTPPPTSTSTPTNTPAPTCNDIKLESVGFADRYFQIRVRNTAATAPVFLSRADIRWRKHTLFPGMYAESMNLAGKNPFWKGPDYDSPTDIGPTSPGVSDDPPAYQMRRFDAGKVTTFQIKFANGPARLSDYFIPGYFADSALYFSVQWGGTTQDCRVPLPPHLAPSPTPPTKKPTNTPTPVCSDYYIVFNSFQSNGVVRFNVQNRGTALAYITGFEVVWNAYNRSLKTITLDRVVVGGSNAFDPAGVVIWDGSDNKSPATVQSGGSGWKVDAVLQPGETSIIWLDFEGTSGRLDQKLKYHASDFNGTTFFFNFRCEEETTDKPTPGPTNTPKPTATKKPPSTPKPPTATPRWTNTPRPAQPTDTPKPKPTSTPKPVNTPPRLPTDTPSGNET